MRTVELITIVATLVGIIATLISIRRRKHGPTLFQRWRARRAGSAERPQ